MYNLVTFIKVLTMALPDIPKKNFALYLSEHDQSDGQSDSSWEMSAIGARAIEDTFGLTDRDIFIDDIRVLKLSKDINKYHRNNAPLPKYSDGAVERSEQSEQEQYVEIYMHVRENGDNEKYPEETSSPAGYVFFTNRNELELKDLTAALVPSRYSVQIVCGGNYFAEFSDFALLHISDADYRNWRVEFVDMPDSGDNLITIGVIDPMGDLSDDND